MTFLNYAENFLVIDFYDLGECLALFSSIVCCSQGEGKTLMPTPTVFRWTTVYG